MSPTLSILIVAYKSRPEIGACLDSLPTRLKSGSVEIIVVDNSSGDGTAELVSSAYPHVHYIAPGKNLGFGAGNNHALKHATGRLVLFLNPDTICNAEALDHCIEALDRDPSIGLISPALRLLDGSLDAACKRSIPTIWDGFCRAMGLSAAFPRRKLFGGYNLTHLPEDGVHEVGAINGAFMLGRADFIRSLGGFDTSYFMYGDDLDLCIRVAKAGKRIIYDGRHAITHIKGASVARDYAAMSHAIFDANRDVLLRHCNPSGSRFVAFRIRAAFALWKWVSLTRARLVGHRKVRPL